MIFFFEVYTKNPETGETGWEIQVGFTDAEDTASAKAKIQAHFGPIFDVFIQCYQVVERFDLGCETVNVP